MTSSQSPPIPWVAAALNIQEEEIYRSKSGGDGALVLCGKRGLQGLIERDSIGLWDEAVGQGIHWLSTLSRRVKEGFDPRHILTPGRMVEGV